MSVSNFTQKLVSHFQGMLAIGQCTNVQILVEIRIRDSDPYCDTGKTCVGGGCIIPVLLVVTVLFDNFYQFLPNYERRNTI